MGGGRRKIFNSILMRKRDFPIIREEPFTTFLVRHKERKERKEKEKGGYINPTINEMGEEEGENIGRRTILSRFPGEKGVFDREFSP